MTALITDRTRLVAHERASNLIGTKPPVCRDRRAVHEVGALHWVDGVHATAHASVDLDALGADFWTCSPYKFLGPHLGVVAASPALLETLTIGQAAPVERCGARAVRAGDPALRAARRHDCGGRRPRRARPVGQRLAARADPRELRGAGRARAAAARSSRDRAARYAGCAAVLERSQAHADPAAHGRREVAAGGAPGSWPRAASTRRPGTSMRSRPRVTWGWATRAGCGSASRPTPTTATSTASSRPWPSSA